MANSRRFVCVRKLSQNIRIQLDTQVDAEAHRIGDNSTVEAGCEITVGSLVIGAKSIIQEKETQKLIVSGL